MAAVTMLVGLKIPDTTAITAFRTLKEMGFEALQELHRYQYYEIEYAGDKDTIQKKLQDVDILVNSNKNTCRFGMPQTKGMLSVVVTNTDPDTGLLHTLRNQLALKEVTAVQKGVLWQLKLPDQSMETAKKISESLLMNPHYQQMKIV